MNENIDLTKILKDCPKGTKLYSTIYGEVEFYKIFEFTLYPIVLQTASGLRLSVTKHGMHMSEYEDKAECTLFPSKDQRDWSKFTAPWYKKEKFDPKTLHPFDKILVRDNNEETWSCSFFSHIREVDVYKFATIINSYKQCIPYNYDTKHLIGTREKAPEYYRYWED